MYQLAQLFCGANRVKSMFLKQWIVLVCLIVIQHLIMSTTHLIRIYFEKKDPATNVGVNSQQHIKKKSSSIYNHTINMHTGGGSMSCMMYLCDYITYLVHIND